MRRFSHIIKGNAKTEMPRYIIFFDTETNEVPENEETRLTIRLGVACLWIRDKKKQYSWIHFKDKGKFWDFVFSSLQKKSKIYLVAHNVAFDFRVLEGFKVMKKNCFKIKKLIYNGTTNIWEFRKGNKTICILDNMNFFKSSLENVGKSIGLEKMNMPDDDENLLIYCKRDVEIMVKAWRILFTFLKENNLGNFSKTIASQAMAGYRHRFMKEKIFIHTWENAVKMERESYHGGRTECFFIGELPREKYYLLDVNSMYPSCMREYDYPKKIVTHFSDVSVKTIKEFLKYDCVVAKCIIKTDVPVFPVKQNNKLIDRKSTRLNS